VWRVELGSQAARTLRKLRGVERERVIKAIDALRTDPRPSGKHVKALEGAPEPLLRYRVGDHRIVYAVIDASQVVVIRGIVARKDLDKWLRTAG
jgi:mRNA interferase RelE/StbE